MDGLDHFTFLQRRKLILDSGGEREGMSGQSIQCKGGKSGEDDYEKNIDTEHGLH